MQYSDINTLRKQGNLQQALVLAEAAYAQKSGTPEAISLFWCLNDDFKLSEGEEAEAIANRMKDLWERHAKENSVLQKTVEWTQKVITPEGQAERKGWKLYKLIRDSQALSDKKELLFQYLKLNNPRPSLLHSLIMQEAVKIDKNTKDNNFNLTIFSKIWNLQNLREDDWIQYPPKDGIPGYSLVEKLIGGLMREFNGTNDQPDPTFIALLSQAIKQFPKNHNLLRYEALLKMRQGQTEAAISKFKQLILNSPDKFYLWDNLADLIENPDIKMGMICGAISCGGEERLLVKVRLKLAEMLCERKLYNNAMTELERYRNTFLENKWILKDNFYNVFKRIPQGSLAVDNRLLYNEFKNKALEFLLADHPSILIVKTWEKKDMINGKPNLNWQLRNDQEIFWLKPKKFRLDFHTPNGSAFKAKIFNGQIAWITPTELENNLSWIRKAKGPLQIKEPGNGKLYAFVDGVYMPGTMIGSHKNGMPVSVIAIRNQDDRWTALNILPVT